MPIESPIQLVDEFKKSGEFDRLRRELLAQVAQGGGMAALKARVQEVAHQRFTSDPKLSFMPQEAIYRELMQEMERFPVVDRVASDVQMLSDQSFADNIRNSVHTILSESKGQKLASEMKDNKTEAVGITSHPERTEVLLPTVVVTATPPPAIDLTTPFTTLKDSPKQKLEDSPEVKTTNPITQLVSDTSGLPFAISNTEEEKKQQTQGSEDVVIA